MVKRQSHPSPAERGARWTAAVAAALLFVVLSLAAWQFWRLQDNLTRQTLLMNAAYAENDRLLQLVNQETSVRGYVATGEPGFLDTYYASQQRLSMETTSIAQAAEMIPDLRAPVAQAAIATAQVHHYFEREIVLMRAHSAVVAKANLPAGKALFDHLRHVDEQTELLLNDDLREQRANTRFLANAGFIACVILWAVLGVWWVAFLLVLRNARIDRFWSLRDQLTGLSNRRGALAIIESSIGASNREPFGVIFIDLDGFKKINDVYGHAAGDSILQTVATRLNAELRERDHVCRIGGDEFICIVAAPTTLEQVRSIARRLCKCVGRPYAFGNDHYVVGCSAGLSMYPKHGDSAQALLAGADRAMYSAKSAGGGVQEVAAPSIE